MKNGLMKLEKHKGTDGNLISLEMQDEIPFLIKRIFYIYDVPKGVCRGNHASKNSDFIFIAIHGKLHVSIDNNYERKEFELNSKEYMLYISSNTWIEVKNFEEGAILLVLSNTKYSDCDYIEDMIAFNKQ